MTIQDTDKFLVHRNGTSYYMSALDLKNSMGVTALDGFKTVLYSGNDGTQTIDVGFKPDLVWTKTRNGPYSHTLIDSVRGTNKILFSNTQDSDATESNNITGWTDTGYTVGNSANVNGGYNYVAWCWKAGDSAVTNNDGTIQSTVSANPDLGFSVVTWTGIGQLGATVGHGLNTKPSIHIYKCRTTTSDWSVSYELTGGFKQMHLNNTNGEANISWSAPTDKVFSVGGGNGSGGSGQNYVAYCWAEVEGFSKFGTYTGNGSSSGPIITTGFKPAWLLIRRTATIDNNNYARWKIHDSARDPINPVVRELEAETTNSESVSTREFDFLEDGFQVKNTNTMYNASGYTYLYMAFADNQ